MIKLKSRDKFRPGEGGFRKQQKERTGCVLGGGEDPGRDERRAQVGRSLEERV